MFVKSRFYYGCFTSLPLVLSYLPLGFLLGAQAVEKNLSTFQVSLMVGLNFAGGSEFAAVKLWTIPPQIFLIALMTLLVNSRHIVMGATFIPYMREVPIKKSLAVLFFMTDESWAVGLNDARNSSQKKLDLSFYFGLSICLYFAWVLFVFLGSIIGPLLGDVRKFGLDMAFIAVFLVLLKGMWVGKKVILPWLVSLAAATLSSLFVDGTWYVLIGILAGILTVAVIKDE